MEREREWEWEKKGDAGEHAEGINEK